MLVCARSEHFPHQPCTSYRALLLQRLTAETHPHEKRMFHDLVQQLHALIMSLGRASLTGGLMAGKNIAVFGIYQNQASAEAAIDNLRSAGFRHTDISVLFPDNEGTKDLAISKGTKAPEGATTGGMAGGIIGGALGWLMGIGALAIPGVGPLVAAGPIVAVLSGVGVGTALGGLIGALMGLGIPEYEAKRFEGRIRKGGILLSVHCDNPDWVKRAKSMLKQTGAEDIAAAGEAAADFAASDRPMPRRGGRVPPPFTHAPKTTDDEYSTGTVGPVPDGSPVSDALKYETSRGSEEKKVPVSLT